MAPAKKKPDHPHGGPPGQSGQPQQYAVVAAVQARGVVLFDIVRTLAPPVEPPPEGVRHDVAVAVTARGRVMATTRLIPAGSGAADLIVTVPDTGDPLLNGDNLLAALTAATPGDVIVLQAGAQYRETE